MCLCVFNLNTLELRVAIEYAQMFFVSYSTDVSSHDKFGPSGGLEGSLVYTYHSENHWLRMYTALTSHRDTSAKDLRPISAWCFWICNRDCIQLHSCFRLCCFFFQYLIKKLRYYISGKKLLSIPHSVQVGEVSWTITTKFYKYKKWFSYVVCFTVLDMQLFKNVICFTFLS